MLHLQGPDEAECEAELASENALARQTEAAIAAQEVSKRKKSNPASISN